MPYHAIPCHTFTVCKRPTPASITAAQGLVAYNKFRISFQRPPWAWTPLKYSPAWKHFLIISNLNYEKVTLYHRLKYIFLIYVHPNGATSRDPIGDHPLLSQLAEWRIATLTAGRLAKPKLLLYKFVMPSNERFLVMILSWSCHDRSAAKSNDCFLIRLKCNRHWRFSLSVISVKIFK
jgi:hypothetical protein